MHKHIQSHLFFLNVHSGNFNAGTLYL
uniref:Uncharacterized protein n=1 Tax=Rhizophora mucronata TaxID=61149 RepID=A0A2P2N9Z3_RHIMU